MAAVGGAAAGAASAAVAVGTFLSKYEYCKTMREGYGEVYQCLGSGGFGVVFNVRNRATGQIFAAKRSFTDSVDQAKKIFAQEVKRLQEMRGEIEADAYARETIIRFEDGFLEEAAGSLTATVYIVMEASPVASPWDVRVRPGGVEPLQEDVVAVTGGNSYGSGCDMSGNPIAQPPLTITQAKHVMRQLLHALAFLHERKIIHRDIKPDNMLVFGRGEDEGTKEVYPIIKISDFGLARAIDPDAKKYTTKVGTKSYRAPELALPKYDAKVDIFSAGCTFFALVMGDLPNDRTDKGFPERFEHLDHAALLGKFPLESHQLDFLAKLTQANPIWRPTAAEALAHPFLSS